MAEAYDASKTFDVLPIKQMDRCRTRARLDAAVAEVVGWRMGFDIERITRIREALCAEPSITGQRVQLAQ